MWDPESTDMESGIHSMESGIQDSLGLPYMGRILDRRDGRIFTFLNFSQMYEAYKMAAL